MLSIRLTRMGRKNRPFYRVVVVDSRKPRDGSFIEILGHYDPLQKQAAIEIDTDKVEQWMEKGARPSDTVRSLLKKVNRRAKAEGTDGGEKLEEVKDEGTS